MFCTSCGIKLVTDAAFCSGCGNPRENESGKGDIISASPVAVSTNAKRRNVIILVIIAVALIIGITVILTSRGGGLRGVWAVEMIREELVPTIRFSGNRFTAISYTGMSLISFQSPYIVRTPWNLDSNVSRERVWTSLDVFVRESEGSRYGVRGAYRLTVQGTYSISGDRLELLFSDGTIQILEFWGTANTLYIGGIRFIRH